jgi:hypothetical protein
MLPRQFEAFLSWETISGFKKINLCLERKGLAENKK